MRVTGSELVGLIPKSALIDAGKYYLKKQGRSLGVSESDILECAVQSLGLNDVSKFNSVLKEYRKSKEVTETRMFLETAEEILSNREKIIVPDGKEGSNLINLLNLKAKEGN